MLDRLALASLPRDRPLRIRSPAQGFTCAICGATQEPYIYRVVLPQRAGTACVNCADDHGFNCVDE